MTLLVALCCFAPTYDSFDGPLDPARWFIGVAKPPQKGVLRIPEGGWIVSRNLPDDPLRRIEVRFRGRGGRLELAFFSPKEPLSSPLGVILPPKTAGPSVLAVTAGGATLDGKPLEWKGKLLGTFRLRACKGAVDIDSVSVTPRVGAPPQADDLEQRTVHLPTTPRRYGAYARVTMALWDTEVCFLLRRGERGSFGLLSAPVRGAPLLAVLVQLGNGREPARRGAAHKLAMRDWGDERRNLGPRQFQAYLEEQYRLFELLQQAQRALNAALPKKERKEAEALVALAVIRHSENAWAAVALAQAQGATAALRALDEALGGEELGRQSPAKLRKAAGRAARAILGDHQPPGQWPGFDFDPSGRFATMEQARELSR